MLAYRAAMHACMFFFVSKCGTGGPGGVFSHRAQQGGVRVQGSAGGWVSGADAFFSPPLPIFLVAFPLVPLCFQPRSPLQAPASVFLLRWHGYRWIQVARIQVKTGGTDTGGNRWHGYRWIQVARIQVDTGGTDTGGYRWHRYRWKQVDTGDTDAGDKGRVCCPWPPLPAGCVNPVPPYLQVASTLAPPTSRLGFLMTLHNEDTTCGHTGGGGGRV